MPTILGAILFWLAPPIQGPILPDTMSPELQGEYLIKRKAVLPDDANGKVAMPAPGFSYDSRFAVEAWVKAR